jgi:hypothetical protein
MENERLEHQGKCFKALGIMRWSCVSSGISAYISPPGPHISMSQFSRNFCWMMGCLQLSRKQRQSVGGTARASALEKYRARPTYVCGAVDNAMEISTWFAHATEDTMMKKRCLSHHHHHHNNRNMTKTPASRLLLWTNDSWGICPSVSFACRFFRVPFLSLWGECDGTQRYPTKLLIVLPIHSFKHTPILCNGKNKDKNRIFYSSTSLHNSLNCLNSTQCCIREMSWFVNP